jgi:hypothetical protein
MNWCHIEGEGLLTIGLKVDFLAKRFSHDFVLNAKNRSQYGTQNDPWSAGY